MAKGRIVKVVSNFYWVDTGTVVVPCKPRGLFKKKGLTPMVGDWADFELPEKESDNGWITGIHPRRNALLRPPVANMDQAVLVFSLVDPPLHLTLLDRFLVQVEWAGLTALLCLSKWDLCTDEAAAHRVLQLYQGIGYPIFAVSARTGEGLTPLRDSMKGKSSVFAGQSGVGKSSLLNRLVPAAQLRTGDVSEKLGRGRHTTRHVELLRLDEESYVVDTPGFSQLDFTEQGLEELAQAFPEFRQLEDECRFRGCTHLKEPSCAVKTAVEAGRVAASRYQHYRQFADEIREKLKRRY